MNGVASQFWGKLALIATRGEVGGVFQHPLALAATLAIAFIALAVLRTHLQQGVGPYGRDNEA